MSADLQTRLDLLKTSSVSSDCLKLFPVGKKRTQRAVVGDNEGVVQAFSIKKGSVNVSGFLKRKFLLVLYFSDYF